MTSMIQLLTLALFSTFLLSARVATAFVPSTPHPTQTKTFHQTQTFHRHQTILQNQLFDTIGSMFKNFGKKASASHILIKPTQLPADEAKAKLLEIKEAVANDSEEFARYASEYSDCPSGRKGGDLGEFGPGMMVAEFDAIAFGEDVGVVHGPVSTSFGEHLIYVTARSGDWALVVVSVGHEDKKSSVPISTI